MAATSGTFQKGKSKQGRQIKSEVSESKSDGQPLASRRVMGKLPLASLSEVQPAISIQQRGTERAVPELAAIEKEASTSTTGAMAVSEKIDGANTQKKTTRKGVADDVVTKDPKDASEAAPTVSDPKKRPKKQRIVLYSNQDSGSDTGLRRSSRKRTAVTKMGGIMTEHISRGDDREDNGD